MFWRVELDKEGAILSCDLAEEKGKRGGRIIYVEAETKAQACSEAKAWHQNLKAKKRERVRKYATARMAIGKCIACGKASPKPGCKTCQACITRINAKQRDRRMGIVRPRPSPEQIREKAQARARKFHERHRVGAKISHEQSLLERSNRDKWLPVSLILARLDELSPVQFREWLHSVRDGTDWDGPWRIQDTPHEVLPLAAE
jgi:hypothetical protein